jgi:hypothetical protein
MLVDPVRGQPSAWTRTVTCYATTQTGRTAFGCSVVAPIPLQPLSGWSVSATIRGSHMGARPALATDARPMHCIGPVHMTEIQYGDIDTEPRAAHVCPHVTASELGLVLLKSLQPCFLIDDFQRGFRLLV